MLGILLVTYSATAQEWVWFFSKRFSEANALELQKKNDASFVLHTPHFSQLILSWNAFRPQKGHFRFWVQAQDSVTKKWYDHTLVLMTRGQAVTMCALKCQSVGTPMPFV
jgi:hypothetical protein